MKVGDMVMVVWGCCAFQRQLIGTVSTIETLIYAGAAQCRACGYRSAGVLAHLPIVPLPGGGNYPFSWLVKTPPPQGRIEVPENAEAGA